ncbi:ATP-dependent DNA ligase [Heyndrickxia shackletonii]|uniref:DNA ligase (ATP) n=1 Tax=Heyndrickxia shackletonii TaxID=157838 RepID=A0A0Q3TJV6_9BACI|nr:DNA ligase D [Heyndrickxia shackletonii]KQL53793.1 ATP-dependent DNA ligase [Heyndrickxia shackletonii]NEZ02274.1 DNA ligase D [Heyndrickxia shackletonii]
MKPMLPTLKSTLPENRNWVYEIKYDGFRAILEWDEKNMYLWSRNELDLLPQFPEIKEFLLSHKETIKDYFPLILDGELVILENQNKANFGQLQIRGRMRSKERIMERGKSRPARYLVFDLLKMNGKNMRIKPLEERKKTLQALFEHLNFPLYPSNGDPNLMQFVPYDKNVRKISDKAFTFDSEGVVAKILESKWEAGKRTESWVKIKNWKKVSCFITAYDSNNGYYHIGVYNENKIIPLGLFLFSISPDQKQALNQVIKENAYENTKGLLKIRPSICIDVHYLEWYEESLREPHFHQFRLDLTPEDCTYEQFVLNGIAIPEEIQITHPDKPLWEDRIFKLDFVRYMRKISPFMLPFLKNRTLTVIRFPHGISEEPFYQKNCPDYAPSFIETFRQEGIEYIVCNDLKTLMWLANQLAIEYHIPFHVNKSKFVSEIVFDLDPPSRNEFHLAVKAALMMKEIFDQLKLISFVKTSGNKGLQIYIPLQEETYTWEDTRSFTEFIAQFLITKEPNLFTIERLKKHRNNRLYIDFVQHAEGKTIISPYSMRGNKEALVATPLYWGELHEGLNPEDFTMESVLKRLNEIECPFSSYFRSKNIQPFEPVLQFLKNTH